MKVHKIELVVFGLNEDNLSIDEAIAYLELTKYICPKVLKSKTYEITQEQYDLVNTRQETITEVLERLDSEELRQYRDFCHREGSYLPRNAKDFIFNTEINYDEGVDIDDTDN